MALTGGHRFAVSMADAFPHGLYATGVERAEDYNEKTGRRTPARDKVTEGNVWTVACIDADSSAKKRDVKIKVLAERCPDLPDEAIPGFRPVEFTGLMVTPYIEEMGGGRSRLAFSFRALGVHAQGKAPAGSATVTGRSDRQAPSGDKAA